MMGATFPTVPIKPDLHRHESDALRYIRLEYGEDNPAWLAKDIEDGTLDHPVPKSKSGMRVLISLRSLAARVAAVLF